MRPISGKVSSVSTASCQAPNHSLRANRSRPCSPDFFDEFKGASRFGRPDDRHRSNPNRRRISAWGMPRPASICCAPRSAASKSDSVGGLTVPSSPAPSQERTSAAVRSSNASTSWMSASFAVISTKHSASEAVSAHSCKPIGRHHPRRNVFVGHEPRTNRHRQSRTRCGERARKSSSACMERSRAASIAAVLS